VKGSLQIKNSRRERYVKKKNGKKIEKIACSKQNVKRS
jgi:hypothetical protein